MLAVNGMANEVFKFYPATFILWISVGVAFSVPYLENKESDLIKEDILIGNDFISE